MEFDKTKDFLQRKLRNYLAFNFFLSFFFFYIDKCSFIKALFKILREVICHKNEKKNWVINIWKKKL